MSRLNRQRRRRVPPEHRRCRVRHRRHRRPRLHRRELLLHEQRVVDRQGRSSRATANLRPRPEPCVRTRTNTAATYQQAILSLEDQVWQAGAQHNLQVYRKSDYQLLRGFVSHPWGDGQALAHLNGIVYKGSHANGNTNVYADAIAARADRRDHVTPIRWMGAFDAPSTPSTSLVPPDRRRQRRGRLGAVRRLDRLPVVRWRLQPWQLRRQRRAYVGGFAKFCSRPTRHPRAAHESDGGRRRDGVNLAWTGSTDDRGGRSATRSSRTTPVFASYISIETFRDATARPTDRYFVRAMDTTGNRSATTRVFTAAANDTTARAPRAVWSRRDRGERRRRPHVDRLDRQRRGHRVHRLPQRRRDRPASSRRPPSPPPADGDHCYQVRAVDAAGNESFKTPSTKVTIAGPTVQPVDAAGLVGTSKPTGRHPHLDRIHRRRRRRRLPRLPQRRHHRHGHLHRRDRRQPAPATSLVPGPRTRRRRQRERQTPRR